VFPQLIDHLAVLFVVSDVVDFHVVVVAICHTYLLLIEVVLLDLFFGIKFII
jgi:hypothetical protein